VAKYIVSKLWFKSSSVFALFCVLFVGSAAADVPDEKLSAESIIALKPKLASSEKMDGGWYAKIGSATVFMAPTTKIPNYDRLNWTIVRVLSEKYGCFIEAKLTVGNQTRYNCRDNRTIITHRYKNKEWMLFHSRQYDATGRELIVEDSRIVGYGPRQI
jgi:hypothetical protein